MKLALRPSGLWARRALGGHGRRCAAADPLGLAGRRLQTWRAQSTASIRFGPTEPPLLEETIAEHFASVVARYADRPALIARGPVPAGTGAGAATPVRETVYTYAELDRVSDMVARGLRRVCGVQRGDHVAVSLGNGPEFAVLTYAVYKLGAVLVPLNPAFTATQVAAALRHLGVRVLVTGAVTDLAYKPGRGRSNRALLEALVDDVAAPSVRSTAVPTLERVVLVDNVADHAAVAAADDFAEAATRLAALTPFSALLGNGNGTASILRPDLLRGGEHRPGRLAADLGGGHGDDLVNIQFTSGTTSQPKAAMLSQRAILNNGVLVGRQMGLTPTDRIVCPPPLFHCFGSVMGYMATATHGAALLLPSPAFDPAASLQMAADHRATGLYGVATMFVAMLERLEQSRGQGQHETAAAASSALAALPSHLHKGIAAGSSVPEVLMTRLFGALGLHDLVICYGMTETAPVSVMTQPDDPLDKRTTTCGRAMPHTAVKIVDPADPTRVLPHGEAGEIASSGYLLMDGYYGEPERTAEVLVTDADGRRWMLSGDEGVMDADGFVAVTGRIKDLIIRGGENIHPLEVENCLFAHPLVAEAAVVGVPDARHGEAVAAFVVPHAGVGVQGGVSADGDSGSVSPLPSGSSAHSLSATDAQDWVRDRMSAHLVPKYILWATDLPKTASGKIQKFKLRDLAKALLKDKEVEVEEVEKAKEEAA